MHSTAHVDEEVHGKVMEVVIHGTLGPEDYHRFVPETESLIAQHGKIRMLVVMHDFHGWRPGALWEDIKWNAKHMRHVERLAIVGEKTWHQWMTGFWPFTSAEVRYFTMAQLDAARDWVNEGVHPAESWDGSEAGDLQQP